NGGGEQERRRMAAGEEEVLVVESCFVTPAVDTPRKALWLSPLDIMLASRGYTPLVHFYRPCVDETSAQDFFDVTKLKTALGKALVAFYPMAGRLRVGAHGRLEIDCNGKGMLFLMAYSRLTINDFRDLKPSSKLRRLFVPRMDDSSDILCATQFVPTSTRTGARSLVTDSEVSTWPATKSSAARCVRGTGQPRPTPAPPVSESPGRAHAGL
uniref:Shikimate O-hydroxycinnamoyltransferase n=1 Tax=Aegilops tauschii subsp. strangulata TaxID=200361 RepID=A0A453QC34_AEGTS